MELLESIKTLENYVQFSWTEGENRKVLMEQVQMGKNSSNCSSEYKVDFQKKVSGNVELYL